MKTALFSILATALSLLIVDLVVPGVDLATFPAALIGAGAIALINAAIKPAISLLSLPFTLLTFGLFSIVVNGLCFWLASVVVPGFRVSGLLAFFLGPVVLSFANTLLVQYFAEKNPQLGLDSDNTPQS